MMDENNTLSDVSEAQTDVLLQQLLHLKQYETPAVDRMTKNQRNIMRQVREVSGQKRWSLSDLIEGNIPWLFAEPRYGIALLFIVFAGLQFWGVSSKNQVQNKTGIYTSKENVMEFDSAMSASATNMISYPKLPDNLQLFASPRGGNGMIKPAAGFEIKR